MRRIVICLVALFLCGCGKMNENADKAAMGNVQQKVAEENEKEKVLLFIDSEEKTKEAASVISDKIQAVVVEVKKLEDADLKEMISKADLILVGATEEEVNEKKEENTWEEETNGKVSDYMERMDRLFALKETEGKRVSLFQISAEEKALTSWEERVGKTAVNLLPSLWLTWEEENREEELNYLNGWLTTAFTYQK